MPSLVKEFVAHNSNPPVPIFLSLSPGRSVCLSMADRALGYRRGGGGARRAASEGGGHVNWRRAGGTGGTDLRRLHSRQQQVSHAFPRLLAIVVLACLPAYRRANTWLQPRLNNNTYIALLQYFEGCLLARVPLVDGRRLPTFSTVVGSLPLSRQASPDRKLLQADPPKFLPNVPRPPP